MLSLEGRQLGNYTVTRRIRSGGMGAVYEGRQRTAFDRRVAIKVILGTYATDPDMRRRFAREARTVARLHHPHILPLIEFGDEQGVLYLVMPFIEGGTLTGYLRRHLPDVHEVSAIFLQLLDAVEYAHDEGLIHRDIKSSNVLLESRRNGPPYVYLADFGLVRTIQQAELESSYAGTPIPLDQVPGTPQYMAPEQTLGIVTPSTDIYALGVLLYQMLTGELPYNDPDDIEVIKMQLYAPVPNPRDTDASIPAELGALVARAMAKRPEQRFADLSEFREAFLAALDRPVEHIEDLSFEENEDEDDVQDLWPAPPPFQEQPLPPRPPRLSQHLRVPPEPIEFGGPPAAARRARITGDPNEALPQRHASITNERADDTPRRPRITGDPDATGRHARAQGAAPEAQVRYARVTEDQAEPTGRHTYLSDEPTEQLIPRRSRATEEPPEEFGARKRQRVTEEQADMPALPRRSRGSAEEERPGDARPRLMMGKLEKAASPLLVPQPAVGGRNAPGEPRPAPGRHPLPGRKKRGKQRLSLLAAVSVLVSVVLLLLLFTRVLGLSIFPAGFPLFGSSSVARISLTARSSSLHDTFLLTASPQITQANASTRVMPDRAASSSSNAIRTVATSGLKSNGGSRASGILHFDNSGPRQITVSNGFPFITSNSIEVRLDNSIVVPARSDGQDGMLDAPATAVEPGQTGNIQAGALNSPCCNSNGQVIVSNPEAFSGGKDGGVTHLVAQNDLDGVKNELTPDLRQQATQQLDSSLQPGEVQVGSPNYAVEVTSDQPVGAVADQVTVTVTVKATVLVYNTHVASDLARQLLSSEARQSSALGPGYQLRGNLDISTPTIEQQGNNGQLYLSISASGLWSYAITTQDENLWRQNIKGASITLAQSYLSTRPGIIGVRIELPFGTDHLPTDETQIVFSLN
jgi:serine/threonine protein kinase